MTYDKDAYAKLRSDPEKWKRRVTMNREARNRRKADEIRSPWSRPETPPPPPPDVSAIALPWVTKARLMAGR